MLPLGLYRPGLHCSMLLLAWLRHVKPAGHGVHAVAPSTLYCPLGQVVTVLGSLVLGHAKPAGQMVQDAAPAAL